MFKLALGHEQGKGTWCLDFEEQLEDFYNKFESEKGFDFDVVSKVSKIIGYWFYSQDSTKKDIEKFIASDG